MKSSAEAFLAQFKLLCEKHKASVYFADRWSELWIDGEFQGCMQDTEEGGGQEFELNEGPQN